MIAVRPDVLLGGLVRPVGGHELAEVGEYLASLLTRRCGQRLRTRISRKQLVPGAGLNWAHLGIAQRRCRSSAAVSIARFSALKNLRSKLNLYARAQEGSVGVRQCVDPGLGPGKGRRILLGIAVRVRPPNPLEVAPGRGAIPDRYVERPPEFLKCGIIPSFAPGLL